MVLLQRHSHRVIEVDERLSKVDDGLKLIRGRLRYVVLLVQDEPDGRRTQIEFLLFGFQLSLGKLQRLFRCCDAGSIHFNLHQRIPHVESDLLCSGIDLPLRKLLLVESARVVCVCRFVIQRNHKGETGRKARVAIRKYLAEALQHTARNGRIEWRSSQKETSSLRASGAVISYAVFCLKKKIRR